MTSKPRSDKVDSTCCSNLLALSELLSRFDLVLETSEPTVKEAQVMMKDVIEWWDRPKAKGTENLGKFLKWVRDHEPKIPETVRAEAVQVVTTFIRMGKETRPRRLESIIRVAKALARLNRRDVRVEDVERAIDLIGEMDQREETER